MGKKKAQAPTLPRTRYFFHVMCQCNPTLALQQQLAAAATGRVSRSTRPDPERSGAVEISTQRYGRSGAATTTEAFCAGWSAARTAPRGR